MTALRKATLGILAGTAPLLCAALAAAPAYAHGAPTDPVSRAAACDPQTGSGARSAACRAAAEARGGRAFEDWDNVRVADVRGRDRQTIPDGKLCSGGIESFAGLDLPRTDWPVTTLTAGRTFTLTYRSTIPHKGTFKLYLTKAGYNPSRPLRWSDLDAQPFATATDPALENGSYRIKATLPGDRTGRHVLYTIWQNTDTPDTYYSCSDVVLTGSEETDTGSGGTQPGEAEGAGRSRKTGPPQDRTAPPGAGYSADSASGQGGAGAAGSTTVLSGPAPVGSTGRVTDRNAVPLAAGAGATILAVAAAIAVATLRRSRS